MREADGGLGLLRSTTASKTRPWTLKASAMAEVASLAVLTRSTRCWIVWAGLVASWQEHPGLCCGSVGWDIGGWGCSGELKTMAAGCGDICGSGAVQSNAGYAKISIQAGVDAGCSQLACA